MSGYDPMFWNFALAFLGPKASLQLLDELARHVQDAVEQWLFADEACPVAPPPKREAPQ